MRVLQIFGCAAIVISAVACSSDSGSTDKAGEQAGQQAAAADASQTIAIAGSDPGVERGQPSEGLDAEPSDNAASPSQREGGGNATAAQSDDAAIFAAAGFRREGNVWKSCDIESASSSPAEIRTRRDLNGDGRDEAILVEQSAICYGMAGEWYAIVSQQPDGGWNRVAEGIGMVNVLDSKGSGSWPDLLIGGPGFCFPVMRWNGTAYVLNRHEYQGKPCQR